VLRTSPTEEAEQEIQHALTAQIKADAAGYHCLSGNRASSFPAPHPRCGADTLSRAG